jgi:alcohol dehydrogenase
MWLYNNPVNIVFGEKKIKQIHKIIDNKKYILITSNSILREYLTDIVNSKNAPRLTYSKIKPNPDYVDLIELMDFFSKINFHDIDFILAIGGGSVMDSAKVIAAFKNNKNFLTDFIKKNKPPIINNALDLIAVPTTSGSSSELTCWATIWDKESSKKFSLSDSKLYPKTAIIDPTLLINKPKKLTIATGLDALSHSMESIWNINANPISSHHAIKGARLVLENLPKLVNDLNNLELRTNLALACIHAGLAFSNTKTAISHNISYPITLKYGIQHGIACSFSLPYIMRSMKGIDKMAEQRLEKIFNKNLDTSSFLLLEKLRSLDLPLNLNELKITKQKWDEIISESFEGERGKNFLGNKSAFDKACAEMKVF